MGPAALTKAYWGNVASDMPPITYLQYDKQVNLYVAETIHHQALLWFV